MLSTPDRNLAAFEWLPLDRWTPDQLFDAGIVSGKRHCRICSRWINSWGDKMEKHLAEHVEEERDRLNRIKAEQAAARESQRAAEKAEREADNPARKPRNSSKPRRVEVRRHDTDAVERALTNLGEATIAALEETTGLAVNVIRSSLKKIGAVEVGRVSTGKRGRPAVVFGLTNTKEA